MKRFIKNLAFIIFHECFATLPVGIYYMLLTPKIVLGIILTISSIILWVTCLTIAVFYHKRNIHVNRYGTITGLIVLLGSFVFEIVLFSWPTDFLLIIISALLLIGFICISRIISKQKTSKARK